MFLVDWRLAVAALAGVPISSGLSIVGARALRRRWRLVREETAELQAQQTDALFHIKTIRLAVAEREILGRVTAAASATVRQQMHAVAGASAFSLASAAAKACVAAIYTWLAWHLLLSRELSTGDYIALAAYVGFLTGPTLQVTGVSTELQMAGIALKRVFAYLDGATEDGASSLLASAGSADGDAPRPQGDVTFTGVTFSYGELRPALREVSFRAHRGQVTAIVGASGAGKSTIGRLLFRLDTPRAGRIAIGGVTAQSCALKPWRCAIGIVPQDATLVRGTLRDNLQLGVASASERDLAEALECCELRELVAALPFGLDTPLGGGSIVSGGQRQRIALARVLLQRPSVVLLDEATSQLDAPTEGRVLDAMLRRLRDCVVIIVSHRPGVAARCDHVIMLQQGVVVEAGSPTELSTRSASYRALQVLPEAPHATVA
jgi:ATP-binding cassette subfamily B protein